MILYKAKLGNLVHYAYLITFNKLFKQPYLFCWCSIWLDFSQNFLSRTQYLIFIQNTFNTFCKQWDPRLHFIHFYVPQNILFAMFTIYVLNYLFCTRPCLSIVLLSGETFKKHSEKENTTSMKMPASQPTSDSTSTYTPFYSSLSSSSKTTSFCSSSSLSSTKFVEPQPSSGTQTRREILRNHLSK